MLNEILTTKAKGIFETAHILPAVEDGKYDGFYSRTYEIEVEVTGPAIEPYGWIIPAEELEIAVRECVPDRKFIFNENDVLCCRIAQILDEYCVPYVKLNVNPSAENLVKYLKTSIQSYITYNLKYENVIVCNIVLTSIKTGYSIKLQDNI